MWATVAQRKKRQQPSWHTWTTMSIWSIQLDKQWSRTLRICHLLTSRELLTLLSFCSLRPLQSLKVMRDSSSFRTQTLPQTEHELLTECWPREVCKKQRDQAKRITCCCWKVSAASECFMMKSTCWGTLSCVLHLTAILVFQSDF